MLKQKYSKKLKKNMLSSFLLKKYFFHKYDIEMDESDTKKVTKEFLKLDGVKIKKIGFHCSKKAIYIC